VTACQGSIITPPSFLCGDESGSSIVTHYAMGQMVNMKWEVDPTREEQFHVDLSVTGRDTDFRNIGTLLNYAYKKGGIAQANIKLPENVKCDNCTLRLRCAEKLFCARICISNYKSRINIQRPGDAKYNIRSADAQGSGGAYNGGGKKRSADAQGSGGAYNGGGKKRSADAQGSGGAYNGGGKKRSADAQGSGGAYNGGGKKPVIYPNSKYPEFSYHTTSDKNSDQSLPDSCKNISSWDYDREKQSTRTD
ncbi:14839_t:CDS:2, partial [Acaulospora colombiana]